MGSLVSIKKENVGKIVRRLSESVEKKILSNREWINNEAKESVKELGVYEKGTIYKNTFATFDFRNKNHKRVIFKTTGFVNKSGQFYAPIPYFGLGTNRKYGQRRWHLKTAHKFATKFNLRKPSQKL